MAHKMQHTMQHKMQHKMLLHGLGQNSDSWEKVLDCLPAEQKEQLHTPNLFDLTEDICYEGLYRGWEQTCQQLSGKLHLCGLSLGAVLALDYAIRHPQQVESLVLIAGQYRSPKFLLSVQSLLFSLMPASNFTQLGISKEQMLRLNRSMIPLDLSRQLSTVRCPVLLLCGEQDKVNRKASEQLLHLLPNAQKREIAGAAHEVNLQAPQLLAKELSAFWESPPQSSDL